MSEHLNNPKKSKLGNITGGESKDEVRNNKVKNVPDQQQAQHRLEVQRHES
jgi:hypothetical protein